jgi:hypothetical protein
MLGSALLFDHIRDLSRICEFSIILSSGQYMVNPGQNNERSGQIIDGSGQIRK